MNELDKHFDKFLENISPTIIDDIKVEQALEAVKEVLKGARKMKHIGKGKSEDGADSISILI